MGRTSHSIEVNAPLHLVYHQWSQFEEFPFFMEAVEEVRREGETRLFWRTRIGGIEKTWEAEITAQIPAEKIAWKSVDGTENAGVITFEQIASDRTKLNVVIDYEPEGILEKAGDILGIPSARIDEDLLRFRNFIEEKRQVSAIHGEGLEADKHAQFYRDAAPIRPSHEEIAARAYELFLQRGSIPGHETADWLQAEEELIEQREREN
jgi:Protein of unknown function (DUF2934)/Polyketide cyclase / dehydrase and lipid transport